MIRSPYRKTWPKRNLGELTKFLDRVYPDGYTIFDLSEKTGMKPQYISYIFCSDNMKLSKAEKIARDLGYRLRLYFPVRETYGMKCKVKKREFPNAGNLAGLAKYISDSNISINYMSQRIGKDNNVLTNAFRKGDIFISVLYEVLGNLKIEVIWEFEPLENTQNLEP